MCEATVALYADASFVGPPPTVPRRDRRRPPRIRVGDGVARGENLPALSTAGSMLALPIEALTGFDAGLHDEVQGPMFGLVAVELRGSDGTLSETLRVTPAGNILEGRGASRVGARAIQSRLRREGFRSMRYVPQIGRYRGLPSPGTRLVFVVRSRRGPPGRVPPWTEHEMLVREVGPGDVLARIPLDLPAGEPDRLYVDDSRTIWAIGSFDRDQNLAWRILRTSPVEEP